jgi:hypothetical protein
MRIVLLSQFDFFSMLGIVFLGLCIAVAEETDHFVAGFSFAKRHLATERSSHSTHDLLVLAAMAPKAL